MSRPGSSRRWAVRRRSPPARCANRRHGPVKGETTWIRERARELGLSMRELAETGRGESQLSSPRWPGACGTWDRRSRQGWRPFWKVRSGLRSPSVPPLTRESCGTGWMPTGWSQNETARRAGISIALLSQIMHGQRTPSGQVLRKLHEVLFRPSAAELVVPAEVKVMAWKKDERQGVVVKGAGGPHSGSTPGGGTVRIGGRVPWGAEVQYAYRAGYDSRGQVSVTHLVDERGYGVMLAKPEAGAA